MIQCQNIYKSYDTKTVLNGIDFTIPDGEIFGLLGPSGAGKTTIIKILTGQLGFDKGSVKILDKEVGDLTGEDKKQIGIMMDQFGLYERLSCADNLKIYADIYGIPHSRVKEILQRVGLADAMKLSAANLSKGMRARLLLARVFMHAPKIIFLDEPTSGLDPQSMRAIHRIILEKKKEGCTIFLTTHNMEEATALCDTVALLNDGKIVDYGKPKEICRKYNHQKKIILHLSGGEDLELSHGKESAKQIYDLLQAEEIETIHSSEPTLETVFLELTGRDFGEEE
ncbi:MAG: ABC transporter ATP-binding protein [Lachnospiraceae bacterium]